MSVSTLTTVNPSPATYVLQTITFYARGTGYTAGDTLTLVGGTGTAATISVLSVDPAGIPLSVSILNAGSYSVKPSSGAGSSVTGGSGSGAKFNLVFIGDTVTVTMYASNYTPTVPPNQTSIAAYSSVNPTFTRAIQINPTAITVKKGTASFSFLASDLVALAVSQNPLLSWSPLVGTQPVASSCTFAKATLTSNGTIPSDGDTVTCGSKTYTFKTALTPSEGQVLIGANAAAALTNLQYAINHGVANNAYGNGTLYQCAAANTQVYAGTLSATTLQIIALAIGTAPNAYGTTSTSSPRLVWGGSTMSGGTAAATFTVAEGSTELTAATFQWQYWNGSSYVDITSGTPVNGCTYSNYTTATLTCTPANASGTGGGTGQTGKNHRCLLLNGAGYTASNAVALTIT